MILVTVTEFRNNLSKYIDLAFREHVALKSKSGILDLSPSKEIILNPSPSGDKWFDNKENVDEINRRLSNIENGSAKLVQWDEVKEELGL